MALFFCWGLLYNDNGDSMFINYTDISKYICDSNKSGEGKEVSVYYYGDKVIKIFHNHRKTPIPRIKDEGLIKLTELSLNCFNTPIDIIYDNGNIVGYTEKYIEEKEINPDNINFNLIKEDLYTLSQNGFSIQDLFYNYIFADDNLYFNDMTSYEYLKTDVEFLKKRILDHNILVMNNFLIGLLLFEAFRKGQSNEYTKIYLANEYRLQNCEDMFYGDYLKSENNKTK